jgi:NAD(P)-dependent dehydrogenase (short-subunit alcohol dehydrogenase family)
LGIEISVICPGWILTRMTDPFKEKVPMWTSMDWAVKFIKSGLARNRGLISFPPSLRFLLWWMSSWPDCVIDWTHPRVMKARKPGN